MTTNFRELANTIKWEEIEGALNRKGYDFNARFEEIAAFGIDKFIEWKNTIGEDMINKMADERDVNSDVDEFILDAVDAVFKGFAEWCIATV